MSSTSSPSPEALASVREAWSTGTMEGWGFKVIGEAYHSFWNGRIEDADLLLEKYLNVHPLFSAAYAEGSVVKAMLAEEKIYFKQAGERLSQARKDAESQYHKNRSALKRYCKRAGGLVPLQGTKTNTAKLKSIEEEAKKEGPSSAVSLYQQPGDDVDTDDEPSDGEGAAISGDLDYRLVSDALMCKVTLATCNFWEAIVKFKKEAYLKGVLYFRKGWKFYDECDAYRRVLAKESDKFPFFDQLCCCLDFGLAIYHFAISAVPKHLMWLVEGIGFKGDRQEAIAEFNRAAAYEDCFRAPFAAAATAWIEAFFFNNYSVAEEILDSLLKKFETGVLIFYSNGYVFRRQGKLEQSTKAFAQAYKYSSFLPQFQLKAEYELGYNNTLQLNWSEAYKHLENHLAKCNSPSFRVYASFQMAVCCLMLKKKSEATTWMKKIGPAVRKNESYDEYAGRQAKHYLSNKGYRKFELTAILCAFLHEGGSFERCLELLKQAKEEMEFKDDKGVYLYLQGSCLQEVGKEDEAEKCYQETIALDKGIKTEVYVFPRCYHRLAELYVDRCNNTRKGNESKIAKAEECLKKAKSYSGYDFEQFLVWKIRKLEDDIAAMQ